MYTQVSIRIRCDAYHDTHIATATRNSMHQSVLTWSHLLCENHCRAKVQRSCAADIRDDHHKEELLQYLFSLNEYEAIICDDIVSRSKCSPSKECCVIPRSSYVLGRTAPLCGMEGRRHLRCVFYKICLRTGREGPQDRNLQLTHFNTNDGLIASTRRERYAYDNR
jgi:hypothetical protein